MSKSLLTHHLEYVPRHVAIIMDGNRRWAKERGLPVIAGHAEGAERLEPLLEVAAQVGVKVVTFFAFSTENWRRPSWQTEALFEVMAHYLQRQTPRASERGVRLRFMGDRSALPPLLQELIEQAQEQTQNCERITALFAINYGARDELLRAMRSLAHLVQQGMIEPDQIGQWHISERLDTYGYGDPELCIRTSGEQRLSNFLLWQLAYSELHFSPQYWPDFSPEHFIQVLQTYQTRHRRFGV